MKKLITACVMLAMMLVLASCEKDENEPVDYGTWSIHDEKNEAYIFATLPRNSMGGPGAIYSSRTERRYSSLTIRFGTTTPPESGTFYITEGVADDPTEVHVEIEDTSKGLFTAMEGIGTVTVTKVNGRVLITGSHMVAEAFILTPRPDASVSFSLYLN